MRSQLIRILSVLTPFVFCGWAPAFAGGGASGDSLSTNSESNVPGVVVRRLAISASEINPDYRRVARWDTADMNMYHVDMTRFRDTLVYKFNDAQSGNYFTVPKQGAVTSGFGHRHLFGRSFHKGFDIDLETGDQVVAAMTGKVRIARYNSGYGNFVVIAHNDGLETLYGHLSELWVKEGQDIESGQVIGLGGSTGQSTGAHLHFEIRIFGEQVDPARVLDPHTLLPLADEFKVDMSWFDHLLNGEEHFHTVSVGQTIDQICALYEMDKEHLLEINNLKADAELPEGTRIMLD
jgi:murein DD-endopeptidase MepM/ murein hydrolase activator NlpD